MGYGPQASVAEDTRARIEASVPHALRRWCNVQGEEAVVKYCTAISHPDGGKLIRLTCGDYVSLWWEEEGDRTLEYAKIVSIVSVVHENREYLFFLPRWFNRIRENGREIVDRITNCCILTEDEKHGDDLIAVGSICESGMKVHACTLAEYDDLQSAEDVCKEDHVPTNRWLIYTRSQGFRGVHRWE